MLPTKLDIASTSGDDIDRLVIIIQKGLDSRQETVGTEFDPTVASIGNDEHGAECNSGLEK